MNQANPFYSHPAYYHSIHAHVKREEGLLLNWASHGDTVLELGSGTGRLVSYFEKCSFYVGLDLSYQMVQWGKKEVPKYRALQGNWAGLPFQSNSFNKLLLLNNGLHHVKTKEGLQGLSREMYRVLKPGGEGFLDFLDLKGSKKLCSSGWNSSMKIQIKGKTVLVHEKIRYLENPTRLLVQWRYQDRIEETVFYLRERQEFEKALSKAGFHVSSEKKFKNQWILHLKA